MENTIINNQVQELPDISKIDFSPIKKSYFKVILMNFSIIVFILLAIFGSIFFIEFDDFDYLYYLPYILSFVVLFSMFYILLIRKEFKNRKYALRDMDISYSKGLLVFSLTSVPFNRIQHVEVKESLFSRFFKLASIKIYTAGDDSSDLIISGLSKEKAYQINEYILNKTKSL